MKVVGEVYVHKFSANVTALVLRLAIGLPKISLKDFGGHSPTVVTMPSDEPE